jgi:hypothetical protein
MPVDRPLLGVAGSWGSAEIELAHRFDDLHQLVYRRGGLRSSNAALEEVAKLILIRLWALRTGLPQPAGVDECRAAFAAALAEPSLVARDAAGHTYPVWPPDEPFRLADPAVLAAATAIVADTVSPARSPSPTRWARRSTRFWPVATTTPAGSALTSRPAASPG